MGLESETHVGEMATYRRRLFALIDMISANG
jgi:hypothetical protein